MEDKYIVRETNEDGSPKDYQCASYEEARKLLDNLAEQDKATHTGEIKHGEEHYLRIEAETLKSYALSIVETTVK